MSWEEQEDPSLHSTSPEEADDANEEWDEAGGE